MLGLERGPEFEQKHPHHIQTSNGKFQGENSHVKPQVFEQIIHGMNKSAPSKNFF